MPNVQLTVKGKRYGGWKRIRASRSIEHVAGQFELEVTDRWPLQNVPWQIAEGDECKLELEDIQVISGYVDSRSIGYDARGHSFSVVGRDKTADLVDSSAILDRWEFSGQSAKKIIDAVAAPFGTPIAIAEGLTLPAPQGKFSISPGDSAFDAISRICAISGVLVVPDGKGGLLITRAGAERVDTALVEGLNILAASADYSHANRFYRYVVAGQHPGSDDFYGEAAASVKAEAFDKKVRPGRVLMVRPEGNVTIAAAQERANWEATVRAGRGAGVQVTVRGWTTARGELWPINKIVPIRSPLLGLDADMLITSAAYSLDDQSGTLTRLTLARPDAFTPEPYVPETETAGQEWNLTSEDPDEE